MNDDCPETQAREHFAKITRNGNIPMSMNFRELAVFEELGNLGLTPLRRGWPDFLAITLDGTRAIGIEVKATVGDRLTDDQFVMHDALISAGIPCLVVYPDNPNWKSELAVQLAQIREGKMPSRVQIHPRDERPKVMRQIMRMAALVQKHISDDCV